jgi:phage shock protein A
VVDGREDRLLRELRWLEENRRRFDEAATYAYDTRDEVFYRASLARLAEVEKQIAELEAQATTR